MTPTREEREMGEVLYYARIKEAWGSHWPIRDKWPKDDEAWRAFPHAPAAEVELILVEAKAALKWFAEKSA